MKAMAGDRFLYILYFQEPGKAEAELDPRARETRADQTVEELIEMMRVNYIDSVFAKEFIEFPHQAEIQTGLAMHHL